ncbi:MAG: B12-binding domain-containing radical SAM protein [Bacteroidales bacterium]|jgi:radical SAM superfamily enzyme YgiQ (UPF0313 family)|nr:B12-binding domain-containing radical SAM protein [Bacteroidales bacterium]
MRILFFDIGEIDYKGIEILTAVLKQHGHTVDLLLDPGLGKHYYLKLPFLNRLFSKNFLVKKAIAFNPDLIGMSVVTNNFHYFREFGQKLKLAADIPIIVGGIHPTSVPEEVIKEDWVDMVCVGDGEEAISELAEKMENHQDIFHIKNLWIKDKNGKVYKNELRPLTENIDLHPFPDRSIYHQYGVLGKRIRFMTGRGCPYQCTFCVNSFRNDLYPGQAYLRKRSVKSIIEELELIKKEYKPKAIRFEDDVFVLNMEWLREFKIEYIKKIGLPFHCYITPSGVKQDVINELRACGCNSIAMGIQSGNPELRSKILNRHYKNSTVTEAAKIIKKSGIKLYAEYMFGIPEETPAKMWETVRLAEEVNADNNWTSIFYPYPKTKLGDYAIENKLIDYPAYNKMISGYGNPHSMSILNHPHATEAFKFKALLPLYLALPFFFKPIIRLFLNTNFGVIHKFLYIVSIPLLEKREFFYRIRRIPLIIYKTISVLSRFNHSNSC